MTILAPHDASRIRNRAMGILHTLAANEGCEVPDILALITTSQPSPASQAPAAGMPDPTSMGMQAEAVPQSPPTPSEPQPSSTPAVQAQDSMGLTQPIDAPSPSLPGAEGAADLAPHPQSAVDADLEEQEKAIIAETGKSGEAEASPAPIDPIPVIAKRITNRQRVRDCHEAHPDWSAAQIAAELGMGTQQVRVIASHISIVLPKAQPKPQEPVERAGPPTPRPEPKQPPVNTAAERVTLADQIRAHLVEHPDATARDVADATGKTIQSIGWAAHRAGITLRKYTAEERSAASARGAKAKVKTAEAPLPPPPIDQFDDDEPAPQVRKVHRAPTGRFYLRDKVTGHWVHQSLQPCPTGPGPLMTSDRKWAWHDTMERYRGAKKLWPELADMRKEAIAS